MASPILHRFPAFVVTLAVVAAASCFTACGLLREDACVSPGDSCAVNSDCCAGLGCILGSCSSPGGSTFGSNEPAAGSGSTSSGGACAQPGDLCNPTPCCDPELPDGGGANVCYFGLVCQACTTAGGVCEFDSDCCAGMTCSNSACTAPSTSKSSGGTSSGSSSSSSSSSSGSSSGAGSTAPACTAYGDHCSSAEPCCFGLACDDTASVCYVAYGNGCLNSDCDDGASFCGDLICAEGYTCLSSTDRCGTPTPCLTYGASGCSSGACCVSTTCDPTDHCSIAYGNPCTPGQTCYDGSACPAISGLCGILTACTPYFEQCTYQPCCSGLVCDENLGCLAADGQPCSFDGGAVKELCVQPDACLPTTGVCSCVQEGGACTPTDLGGEPCCNGFSCETGTCL